MSARPNPLDALSSKTVNPEAERAVIAALIRKPDGNAILSLDIRPDLFVGDATREAYSAIRAEILDSIQPDLATLGNALSPAAKIEFETSLTEHASAANLPHWVDRLKACRHEREIEAARERLANAVKGDASDDEIARLSGELRQLRSGRPGNAPLLRRLDLAHLEDASLTPKCIVEDYL